MGRYSQYGLDEKKQSKDDDSPGKSGFCLWCDESGYRHSKGRGFSMCFVNFMICSDCVDAAFIACERDRYLADGRWQRNECFKCRRKDVEGYLTKADAAPYVICEECMQWAREVLSKPVAAPAPAPGEQLKLF